MTTQVSKDTEDGIKLLLKICEVIMHRFEIESGERTLINGETKEDFDEALVDTSGILFRFLEDYEEQYGGGYMDIGPSRSLREISEGKLTEFNLKGLFKNYQSLVSKFVLLDAHRSGQSNLAQANAVYAQFSKRRTA